MACISFFSARVSFTGVFACASCFYFLDNRIYLLFHLVLPHKGRVSVIGLVGPFLWLDEAALDNLPDHDFKRLAVAFVQSQQKAGEHGEYHNQRGGAGGDAAPDQ